MFYLSDKIKYSLVLLVDLELDAFRSISSSVGVMIPIDHFSWFLCSPEMTALINSLNVKFYLPPEALVTIWEISSYVMVSFH